MLSKEEIATFRNDFVPLLKLCRTLVSGFRDEFLDNRNLAVANEYAQRFSEKYRTLKVLMEKGSYELPKPAILLGDEKDFYSIFSVAESIMPELESVTILADGKHRTYDAVEFKLIFNELKPSLLQGAVCFNYTFKEAKRRIELKYRKEYGMIQLIDDDFMFDETDPEFALCMHYAFDKGYDERINLSKYPLLFIGRTESEPESFKGSLGGRGAF